MQPHAALLVQIAYSALAKDFRRFCHNFWTPLSLTQEKRPSQWMNKYTCNNIPRKIHHFLSLLYGTTIIIHSASIPKVTPPPPNTSYPPPPSLPTCTHTPFYDYTLSILLNPFSFLQHDQKKALNYPLALWLSQQPKTNQRTNEPFSTSSSECSGVPSSSSSSSLHSPTLTGWWAMWRPYRSTKKGKKESGPKDLWGTFEWILNRPFNEVSYVHNCSNNIVFFVNLLSNVFGLCFFLFPFYGVEWA